MRLGRLGRRGEFALALGGAVFPGCLLQGLAPQARPAPVARATLEDAGRHQVLDGVRAAPDVRGGSGVREPLRARKAPAHGRVMPHPGGQPKRPPGPRSCLVALSAVLGRLAMWSPLNTFWANPAAIVRRIFLSTVWRTGRAVRAVRIDVSCRRRRAGRVSLVRRCAHGHLRAPRATPRHDVGPVPGTVRAQPEDIAENRRVEGKRRWAENSGVRDGLTVGQEMARAGALYELGAAAQPAGARRAEGRSPASREGAAPALRADRERRSAESRARWDNRARAQGFDGLEAYLEQRRTAGATAHRVRTELQCGGTAAERLLRGDC